MKTTVFLLILLIRSFLDLTPANAETSYLLRLKNGGAISTRAHWSEEGWLFFLVPGGVAGIEKKEVNRIETREVGAAVSRKMPSEPRTERGMPPPGPSTENAQGRTTAARPSPEDRKATIAAYRARKDLLNAQLEELLNRQREAAGRGDHEAKKRLEDEIILISKDMYRIADEATEMNQGKLPENWWGK